MLLPRTEETSDNEDVRSTYINGYHSHNPCPTNWLPEFNGKSTHCERDGSVRTTREGYSGVEFVTPPLKGAEGIQYLCDIADRFREDKCKVNRSCGLHLHVGLKGIVGNAKVDDVVAFLAQLNKMVLNFQDGLYAQTGTRRDRNDYCKRHKKNENLMSVAKDIANKPKGPTDRNDHCRIRDMAGRYRCVNLRHLHRGMYATTAPFEFRFPAGTPKKDKIPMPHATLILIGR